MTSFRNQSWGGREGSLGDEAEQRYIDLAEANGWSYVRYGLNRPPLHVASLPKFIRYQPDFMESRRLVECQGGGYDRLVKIKVEKANELSRWHRIHPLTWFLWNRKIGMYSMPTHDEVLDVIARRRYTTTYFDETKAVYSISNGEFSWAPYPEIP